MKYFLILTLMTTFGRGFAQTIEYKRTPLGDSVDKASMKLLKETFQNAKDKNVIASPLGVLTLLSMYSAGTEGQSRDEIMQLLGSTDYEQLQQAYGNLTEKFGSMDPSYLVLANKIYVSDQYTLNDQFSDVASQLYKSKVEQVDFTQKKATVDRINKWSDEKTKGHIKSPVDEGAFDDNTAAALFNVIFFQGHWHVPFDVKNTEEKDFYVATDKRPAMNISEDLLLLLSDLELGTTVSHEEKDFYVSKSKSVKKPMMRLAREPLFYYEDEEINARMVELPYKETGFRMVIVLPDDLNGLPSVLEKLAQKGILENVFKLSEELIVFEMPKFEIRNNLDLNDILPKVGVSRIFYEGARGIVREEPVKVSEAFQQAFVKVDEEGAIAGALTGMFLSPRSSIYVPPPPIYFNVDHPFMFIVMHEDIVLFTGTYSH